LLLHSLTKMLVLLINLLCFVLTDINHSTQVPRNNLRMEVTQRDSIITLLKQAITNLLPRQDGGRNLSRKAISPDDEVWKTYLECAEDLIFTVDFGGNFTWVNQAVVSLLGYPSETIIGRSVLDIVAPEDVTFLASSFRRIFAGEEIDRLQYEVVARDNTRILLEMRGSRLPTLEHEIGGLFIARDLTERAEIEWRLREINQTFQSLVNGSPLPICILDLDGIVRMWNPAAELTFGWSAGEITGKTLPNIPATKKEEFCELFMKMKEGISFYGLDASVLKNDGEMIEVSLSSAPIFDGEEKIQSIMLMAADITERKRMEESEREQRLMAEALRDTAVALNSTLEFDELLDRILNNIANVVPHDSASIMLVEEGIAYSARTRRFGEKKAKQPEQPLRLVIGETPNLYQMAVTGQPLVVSDVQVYSWWLQPTGKIIKRSYVGVPIRVKGRTVGFLNLESISPAFFTNLHAERLQTFAEQAAVAIENTRLYEEVQKLAITDHVTEVLNRRGVAEYGNIEIERAKRYGHPLSAIMLDLDNFKRVNDAHGHLTGDLVLKGIADRLRREVRKIDIFGRFGGDEFIILLPEIPLNEAKIAAKRLQTCLSEKPIKTERGEFAITATAGIARMTKKTTDVKDLVDKADKNMYRAKNHHGN
jgi:diguanylate cyclase (GGDEF)-like protein/PAS domain S-box-containing protein